MITNMNVLANWNTIYQRFWDWEPNNIFELYSMIYIIILT